MAEDKQKVTGTRCKVPGEEKTTPLDPPSEMGVGKEEHDDKIKMVIPGERKVRLVVPWKGHAVGEEVNVAASTADELVTNKQAEE